MQKIEYFLADFGPLDKINLFFAKCSMNTIFSYF